MYSSQVQIHKVVAAGGGCSPPATASCRLGWGSKKVLDKENMLILK